MGIAKQMVFDAEEEEELNETLSFCEFLLEAGVVISGSEDECHLKTAIKDRDVSDLYMRLSHDFVDKYFHCGRCSDYIPASELRRSYEETNGLCSYCDHMWHKDD